MTTKTDKLVIQLETDGSGKVKASLAGVSKEVGGLDDQTQKTSKSLLSFKNVLSGLAVGAIAREIITTADTYGVLQQRIKTATSATQDYVAVSEELFNISLRNGTELETTVSLFQNLSRAAPELQATNDQMIDLVDAVQQLGIISGASQSALDAGLLQFSQGLSAGVFRAEEFNSILENIPEVGARIAKGMGLTVGELRKAVLEGEVLSKDVFDALLKQAPEIAEEFEGIPVSLSRSLKSMNTAFAKFVGELDKATGFTERMAEGFSVMAATMANDSPFQKLTNELDDLKKRREVLSALADESTGFMERANAMLKVGLFVPDDFDSELDRIDKRIAELHQKRVDLYNADYGSSSGGVDTRNGVDAAGSQAQVADETKRANKELEEYQKRLASLRDELDPAAAATRDYMQSVADLDRAFFDGLISGEEYEKLIERLAEGEDLKLPTEGVDDFTEHAVDSFDRLEAAARGWGNEFTNTLADMVQNGKLSFSDLADSIIADLLRIAIFEKFTKPLFGSLGIPGFPAPTGHTGGLIGQTTGSTYVDPAVFMGAPRMHTGGVLGPNEVPFIGKRGEEVLTEDDPRHINNQGQGGSVKVELINQSSGELRAEQGAATFDAEGMVVRVFLKDWQRGGPIRRTVEGGTT